MDLVVSSTEASLIEQLEFKLPPNTSFAQERRLVSAQPSGASQFTPDGVRVMRFVLTGGDGSWLDPSTLRLAMKVRNLHPTDTLFLASGPWCLFDQVRLLIGGVEVERIGPYYGRQHHLFRHLLMSNAWNIESGIEDGMFYDNTVYPQVSPRGIAAGQYLSYNLTPLLGILNANKYLPLAYMGGMQLEFTLGNVAEALASTSDSRNYQIEQAQMRMSTVRLDSALNNSFSQLLLQGRALQIPIKTLHLQQQALPAGNTEVQVSLVRALSRLAGLLITFVGPTAYTSLTGQQLFSDPANTHLHTSFLNPTEYIAAGAANGSEEALLEWQVQIGPKNYPEAQPASNMAETFSLLRQATGIYDESLRTTSITTRGFGLNQFCIAAPLQVVVGQPFSSVNTRSGDLLTVRVNKLDGTSRQAGRVFVHMIAETIIELKESGVVVLD
jgi:hypothetical protein